MTEVRGVSTARHRRIHAPRGPLVRDVTRRGPAIELPLLLVLDLAGTFAFGLNGALTAVRAARLDIVGVLTLGVITALGGGVIRDVLIGVVPPSTFRDWRYLALASAGAIIAFVASRRLARLETPIVVVDAVGLSVFAVMGTAKALDHGLGIGASILLGTITAVGGGTIRDTMVGQIPTVLRADLYAIPAMIAAALTAASIRTEVYGLPAAFGAASACFLIRMLGVQFGLQAPRPPGTNRTTTSA